MLKKNLSVLSGLDLDELHQSALAYYGACDALNSLAQSQDCFRAAVAAGAFDPDRVQAVLHELDELAQAHRASTAQAFNRFQDLAFAALERGMGPGFRGELIELVERSPASTRRYAPYLYARLDVDVRRWTCPSQPAFALYVSENVEVYGGPDDSAGRRPSQCRTHTFQGAWSLPQEWDWQIASL